MIEAKERVINQISSIESEDFMNSLLDMLQYVDNNGVYQLSKDQIDDINISLKQIKNGEFSKHEEVMNRLAR